MINVSYTFDLPYVYGSERPRPILRIELGNVAPKGLAVQLQAHLDSGADNTIFQGEWCSVIGLELLSGAEKRFQTAARDRAPLIARIHRVRVMHENLGEREMDVAFATEPLARNLLGLDFFNLFKIGFQDRANRVLFEPE